MSTKYSPELIAWIEEKINEDQSTREWWNTKQRDVLFGAASAYDEVLLKIHVLSARKTKRKMAVLISWLKDKIDDNWKDYRSLPSPVMMTADEAMASDLSYGAMTAYVAALHKLEEKK